MKILHTADWHIGKVLHKYYLRDELILFLDWLIDFIEKESIDLLLISGDIFDLANPAVIDRKLYYQFLNKLIQLKIKVIITGGNHDAVGVLNAPQKILETLDITVIGGATENIEDELIEIKDKHGEITVVVAAVPFLRDKDLRSKDTDKKYKNRTEAIREGIKEHYAQLAEICDNKYANIPIIAMGHLYTKDAFTSDSERDIHVGNAAGVDSNIFSSTFDYVALGHIHRPQIIDNNGYIQYSGSPIALSFSEKEDQKSIVILRLENGQIKLPEIVEIPKSRALVKFTGNLTYIKHSLSNFTPEYPLTSFVEIEVIEEKYSDVILTEVDQLVNKYSDSKVFTILKPRITFNEKANDITELFKEGDHIEDLLPLDVFKKLMDNQQFDEEQQIFLKEAFIEMLEAAQSEDS